MIKRIISSVLTTIICVACFAGCAAEPKQDTFKEGTLTVYFFDVGQADCSLLLFPDETVVLIDAGNKADGKEVSAFLDDLGVDVIDYFVLTHPHEDHIGGAVDIFEDFTVSTVCMPEIDESYLPATAVYKNTMAAVENEKCRELSLTAGTVVVEKEDFNITAVAPRKNSIYSDMNDYSLTLLINCFTNTILFTGDAEKPSELDMLSEKVNLDADILKVGHHGSGNSSTKDFLSKVTPQVSVISCGEGNTYGHPHDDAVERLQSIGSKVYRTDTVGTVIAKCYDGGFNIETDNTIELDGNR